MMRRRAIAMRIMMFLVAVLAIAPGQVFAQRFETAAKQAILVHYDSGTVLFEKSADDLIAPASLVKIMAAEVIFDEMGKGRLKAEDEFLISENAWRRGGAPAGGSSMFALVNSRVKLSDLVPGLIVMSGNDAAIALAEGIAGTEENFARMMTTRARELGLQKSVFRNATGLPDPEQKSTMREIAKLSEHLIRRYPEQYGVFGLREFTWNKVRQQNRNPLLTMDIGADGLKTGMIADSGFSLAASAVQNGQRLIVVISGLPTAQARAQEARKLLEYGFRGFETRQIFPANAVIGQAKVYGGASSSVDLVAKEAVNVLIPRGNQDRLSARIVYTGPLLAPVKAGDKVGVLKVGRGDIQALDIPLYAAADVPAGSLTQRATDAAVEYGGQLVRQLLGNRLGGTKP